MRSAWIAVVSIACSSSNKSPVATATQPEIAAAPKAEKPACEDLVLLVENGEERGWSCASKLASPSVVVDLRDGWTPKLFAPEGDAPTPEFRASYLALANERDANGKVLTPLEGMQELYGIVPSLAIVRARLAQSKRYQCRAGVPLEPIAKLDRPYGQEHAGIFRMAAHTRNVLGPQLEKARDARKLPDFTGLAGDREFGAIYERWRKADELHQAVVTAQRHLVCEGYLREKDVDGLLSWQTGAGLEMFQRRNFLLPNNRLDGETRAAMAIDPKELDFRLALRILRERVVDATGLLEDGTAGPGVQPILGRELDPDAMQKARGRLKPLPDAAPDLISAATEAAAKHLGWTDPAKTAAFLARHRDGVRVAIALPPPPSYHSKHVELSVVIDRGDVWYDEAPQPRIAVNRPNLVIYVHDNGVKRALVRWPTTIGGWSAVTVGGRVVQKWKESDIGPRVWRDLYAAPTWIPPPSTPDSDLVKWTGAAKWELKKSIMGPGPGGAFGIVLLPHLRPVKQANNKIAYANNGIGTHGSATVMSILHGTSHGCHRLYNQLAVRLGTFLLHHRNHEVRGQEKEFYRRTVFFNNKAFKARLDTRGYRYEFTPPIPVEVTEGTIRSPRKVPPAASAPVGAGG